MIEGTRSLRCSEARQRRGHLWRGRSRASGCGTSACACSPADDSEGRPTSARSCRDWPVGLDSAVTFGSTSAGARQAMPRKSRDAAEFVALAPESSCYGACRRDGVATGDSHGSNRVPGGRDPSAPTSSTAGAAVVAPASCRRVRSGGGWLALLSRIAPGVAQFVAPAIPGGMGQPAWSSHGAGATASKSCRSMCATRAESNARRRLSERRQRRPDRDRRTSGFHRDLIFELAVQHRLPRSVPIAATSTRRLIS